MHRDGAFTSWDTYLNYDFEAVTYHQDHRTALIYARSCGTAEYLGPVAYHSRLSNDTSYFGQEISCEEYERGFPFR